MKYTYYSTLANLFNISVSSVSKIVTSYTNYLFIFFRRYIVDLDNFITLEEKTSQLNSNIKYVIDGTITPIQRPKYGQKIYFRSDKKTHFINTMIIVDFNKMIRAVSTSFPGSLPDNIIARRSPYLRNFVQSRRSLALGDPGFGGVSYVLCGYKGNQLNSPGRMYFDKISRSEQVIVENVNSMFKRCLCVSKVSKKRHSIQLVGLWNVVAAGWYNWKQVFRFPIPTEEKN